MTYLETSQLPYLATVQLQKETKHTQKKWYSSSAETIICINGFQRVKWVWHSVGVHCRASNSPTPLPFADGHQWSRDKMSSTRDKLLFLSWRRRQTLQYEPQCRRSDFCYRRIRRQTLGVRVPVAWICYHQKSGRQIQALYVYLFCVCFCDCLLLLLLFLGGRVRGMFLEY